MTERLRRAVFFDRDGVLNEAIVRNGRPYPPASLDQLRIATGAIEALEELARAGYVLVVVTNQPDVARGKQSHDVVEAINAAIRAAMPVREVLTCYHDDYDNCACRKPKPGLLLEAAQRHSIDLTRSFMIGDRWKDVEAGQRAGCQTLLLGSGYGEVAAPRPADRVVQSVSEAVSWILARNGHDI